MGRDQEHQSVQRGAARVEHQSVGPRILCGRRVLHPRVQPGHHGGVQLHDRLPHSARGCELSVHGEEAPHGEHQRACGHPILPHQHPEGGVRGRAVGSHSHGERGLHVQPRSGLRARLQHVSRRERS